MYEECYTGEMMMIMKLKLITRSKSDEEKESSAAVAMMTPKRGSFKIDVWGWFWSMCEEAT